MSKKKIVKPGSKRKSSSRAVAAKHPVEIVETDTVKDVIAETEAEEASAVAVTTKAVLEAEPAAVVEECRQAESAKGTDESLPVETFGDCISA